MVKFFENLNTYKYPWATVTSAFWAKYPNPMAAHVQELDCYHRELDAKSGNLLSKRLITCASAIPGWMSRLGFPSVMYAQEESIVNARDKKLLLRTTNITGSGLLLVEETCSYEVHPENEDWTLYKQEAKITALAPMFCDAIERHSLQNMTSQAKRGLDAMELIINKLQSQGLDAVLPALPSMNTNSL
eukprot:TRINITY_DN1080_c0_g1_i2.p1 TRINITY_DN1080_c0_g1~~TRINITY_DN1080_c0_g1_i2.p1  ORF type:complete len:188 (-),score=43.13 TRINITY_DN1080_c0_g1_i2:239-802(-)